MKKLFISVTCIFASFVSFAQDQGHEIHLKITGLPGNDIIMAYHLGEKIYVYDTLSLNNDGEAVFKGEEKIPGGMYLFYLPNKKTFDLIIGEDQHFSIENDTTDFLTNIKITGSEENHFFYSYQRFFNEKREESKKYIDEIKQLQKQNKSTEKPNEKLKELGNEVKKEIDKIVKQHPELFVSKFLLMTKEFEMPDPPKDKNGKIVDSLFQYRYFKNHFFDRIDFSDERIIRTPILEGQMKKYFMSLPQIPDTLIQVTDRLIEKAAGNPEVFKFVLDKTFTYFNESNVMGMDAVLVNLVEKYYLTGKADWITEESRKKLHETVMMIKPNLIGKEAPELLLENTNKEYVSLHQVMSAYTVLIFWEPDCGHCKKEIPKLHQLYEKFMDKGVEVYAVYTHDDKEKWETFLNEHQLNWINVYDPHNLSNFRFLYNVKVTPYIYLLDKDKKIIAKKISVETLEEMLNVYLKKEG